MRAPEEVLADEAVAGLACRALCRRGKVKKVNANKEPERTSPRPGAAMRVMAITSRKGGEAGATVYAISLWRRDWRIAGSVQRGYWLSGSFVAQLIYPAGVQLWAFGEGKKLRSRGMTSSFRRDPLFRGRGPESVVLSWCLLFCNIHVVFGAAACQV